MRLRCALTGVAPEFKLGSPYMSTRCMLSTPLFDLVLPFCISTYCMLLKLLRINWHCKEKMMMEIRCDCAGYLEKMNYSNVTLILVHFIDACKSVVIELSLN